MMIIFFNSFFEFSTNIVNVFVEIISIVYKIIIISMF